MGVTTFGILDHYQSKYHYTEAKIAKTKMDIAALETALKMYKIHNGVYPQSLKDLVERPQKATRWKDGGYLEKGKVPKDSWGNEYAYVIPGHHGPFDLISYGPDGEPGGDDRDRDINNWDLD